VKFLGNPVLVHFATNVEIVTSMPFNTAKLNYVRLHSKELILSKIGVRPQRNWYRSACIAIWFRK